MSSSLLVLLCWVAESYPTLTLCNPMDCSPPGSSVRGISQARGGCHFLLQGNFLTQGWNLHLLHCSFTTEPPGKPLKKQETYKTSWSFLSHAYTTPTNSPGFNVCLESIFCFVLSSLFSRNMWYQRSIKTLSALWFCHLQNHWPGEAKKFYFLIYGMAYLVIRILQFLSLTSWIWNVTLCFPLVSRNETFFF